MAARRLEPAREVGGVGGGIGGQSGGEQRLDAIDLDVERVVAEFAETPHCIVQRTECGRQVTITKVRDTDSVAHLGHAEVVSLAGEQFLGAGQIGERPRQVACGDADHRPVHVHERLVGPQVEPAQRGQGRLVGGESNVVAPGPLGHAGALERCVRRDALVAELGGQIEVLERLDGAPRPGEHPRQAEVSIGRELVRFGPVGGVDRLAQVEFRQLHLPQRAPGATAQGKAAAAHRAIAAHGTAAATSAVVFSATPRGSRCKAGRSWSSSSTQRW